MNLTGKYWIISHWDIITCVLCSYVFSLLPFSAEIHEREVYSRAGGESCLKPVPFIFWKGLYALTKSSMVSLDGNGGHLKAAREKRSGFMGPSSSRDMFFHIRPQGRLCGGLREAEIPLKGSPFTKDPPTQRVDGSSRDKGSEDTRPIQ